jgi:L-threonylcarbamoyladenylate synthase
MRSRSPRPCDIEAAAEALRAGALVIMPTETVYGLAADAGNAAAVARLYEAKGRPAFNPLIAHVRDTASAAAIADLDARALLLAEAFWPGPLTIVAPIRDLQAVCETARAGLDTIAVRGPADERPLIRWPANCCGRSVVRWSRPRRTGPAAPVRPRSPTPWPRPAPRRARRWTAAPAS